MLKLLRSPRYRGLLKITGAIIALAILVAAGPVLGKLNRLRIRLVGDKEAREIVAEVQKTSVAHAEAVESVDPARATLNRKVADQTFTDLSGTTGSLGALRGQTVVISMTSPGCPVSKKATPALSRLPEEFAGRGVVFLLLNADVGLSSEDLKAHAAEYPGWRYVYDPEMAFAANLGARTTTETFVIDPGQTLRYRGALDNRFDVGSVRQSDNHEHFLHEAIAAAVENRKGFPTLTPAPGCVLKLPAHTPVDTPVTWHNQIARFIQANCVECHRPGEAAPFPLETYDQVRARKGMIEYVLEDKLMPPWFADPSYGHWRNDRFIPESERLMFTRWMEADCPEGDPAETPLAWKWREGWSIAEPDLVLDVEPQKVPAEGFIPWRKMPVQMDLSEDRWVSEAEIRPSVPEVVHHAMLFVEYADDDPRGAGQTRGEAGENGGSEGYWLSYFPGRKNMILPEGRGKLLPKNGKVFIQLHYNPIGKEVEDASRVGFKFLDAPPEHQVVSGGIVKGDFVITPNSKPEFIFSRRFSEDVRLVALMPHMHSRGASASVYLKHADGRIETLLDVPRYDFDWQVSYEFDEPMLVTEGSRIVIRHSYNNTQDNPDNPDPAQEVRHGNATSDEMMINFFEWEPAGAEGKPDNEYRPFQ